MEYNTDKQNLHKTVENVEHKILDVSRLVNNTAFDTKTGEVEKKNPDVSRLVTNTAFDTKLVKIKYQMF